MNFLEITASNAAIRILAGSCWTYDSNGPEFPKHPLPHSSPATSKPVQGMGKPLDLSHRCLRIFVGGIRTDLKHGEFGEL